MRMYVFAPMHMQYTAHVARKVWHERTCKQLIVKIAGQHH